MNGGNDNMNINIPKTKAQKEFELKVKSLIEILSDMNIDDIQRVIEFAIFIDN